ncbi:MAG TPA: fibronectin type III domain-containing protein [Flavitalea sp.]|nr:fibronectin type III domain-containing protein [Flavitalea sp.]
MPKAALTGLLFCVISFATTAQNVFNPNDPLVRWDSTAPAGSVTNPNQFKTGLQKWVSSATNSISVGYGAWDASSYKAYMIFTAGAKVAFRLKFPNSYNNPDSAGKKYPVMLFFHGAGEPGCPANGGIYNNEKQLLHGGEYFRNKVDSNQFDGFLLYPQAVVGNDCASTWPGTADGPILALLDSLTKYVRADGDRLFINGLSDGARNTWRWARTYPQRVAEIGPSSMWAQSTALAPMVHIPVWFASGGKDTNPSPAQSQSTITTFTNLGGKIRYTLYPDLGHGVWDNHWHETDYVPFMNQAHKANPLVFFQRYEWCPGPAISARLGVTAGFFAYEWQKDNVTIATRTNNVNTISNPAVVQSFTGNEIIIKAYGTYRVRFRRTASAAWSAFSPIPAVIKVKLITQTAPIQVVGNRSIVMPALDGSTTVPLTLPAGFINYKYYRASDNVLLFSQQNYNAPAGTFKAKYEEQFGCGTNFSPNFLVVNANGSPKPAVAGTLIASPTSQTSVALSWINVPNPPSNETGFEIYRGLKPGGPYQFIKLTPADSTSYQDSSLAPNTSYYYVVRAVNNTGAAAGSNEVSCKTLIDNKPPTSPTNVRYAGSTTTSVGLAWNASSDNIGIKRYDIYVNGVKIYSTSATSFTVNNLDSLTWYAFTVKAVDASGNASAPSSQIMGYTHRQGLTYKYVTGSFNSLPDFNALPVVRSGTTTSINTGSSFRTQDDNYAILWEGYIYVPVTANYFIATNSDEGSRVYLDMPYSADAVPVVDNDGIHATTLKYSVLPLTKGYHQIAVTYFDRTGGESMGLYWTNDAGLDAGEITGSYFTPVNVDGIPPLIAPSGLTATATSYNKIRLNWTDLSPNEKGFEVIRSMSSGGASVSVGTVGVNISTFTDSALSSATTYYYKIRAIGTQSESPYSDEVFETTLAAPGTPIAPSALSAQNISPTFISLSWIDNANNEDNIQVWRSTDPLVNFQVRATMPANSNSYTDNTVTAFTQYYYYVVGVNGNGNGNASDTLPVIAGNNAPVVTPLARMYVKSDATVSQDFNVTDPGDNVTVTIVNKPSFITISKLAGTAYRITLNPTTDNIGWYNLVVRITDSKAAVTTTNLAITVADKNTRSVFINFGSAGKTMSVPWNNWLGLRGANNVISNLRDENNVITTFSVTTVTAWTGLTNLGHLSGNNSGVFPDSVLESGLMDNGAAKQIRVSGLNPAMRYNLVFAGSQNEGLDASVVYSIGTQRDTLNARYNTNQTANLNGIVPDASGSALVTITRLSTALVNYLNAMVIEEYSPSITVLNPLNLFAETADRTSINLSWSDRASNENIPDGYEVTRATDSMFTLNVAVVNLPANRSVYQATSLSSNQRYWFRVRAKSGITYSATSNRASAYTPASIVYVNFNATVTNAASPWNNTVAQPTSPTTFSDLTNQQGINSGLSLKIEQIFNGEFSAGVVTGNNSGIAPDNVLKAAYWIDKTQLSTMRLSGLNQTRKYRIGFLGSSGPQGWYKDNYTATYTVNGTTVYLNSWGNSSKIVYINNISPDDGGEVVLNFSTTAAAAYGFNSGVIIEDYTDPSVALVTSPLVLEGTATPINATDNMNHVNRMYPNPFDDLITVDYMNTTGQTEVSAFVYDISGRLVNRTDYKNLISGANQLRLAPGSAATGNKVFTVVLAAKGKIIMVNKMVRR